MKLEFHTKIYPHRGYGLHWSREAFGGAGKLTMIWLDVGRVCLWVIIS